MPLVDALPSDGRSAQQNFGEQSKGLRTIHNYSHIIH
jgi:hypothetical protein